MITKNYQNKSNFNTHEPTMTKTNVSFQLKHETKDKNKKCAKRRFKQNFIMQT
jgi:hypothetical protein